MQTGMLTLALALSAQLLQAQSPIWSSSLSRGAGVRVAFTDTSAARVRGTLSAVGGDSLRVEIVRGAIVALPLQNIRYVDESLGRSRLKYAALGVLAGGAIGGTLGVLSTRDDPEGFADFMGMLVGVTMGAPLGGIAGAVFAPERWTRHWNIRER